MSRNLDSSLSAALSKGAINPCLLAEFQFPGGEVDVWSGVGNLTWNGKTFKGIGQFGRISAIGEGTDVQADGLTVQLLNVPLPPSAAGSTATGTSPTYQNAAHNGVQPGVSVSVTISVNAGDLILVVADQNTYATSVANAYPAISDSQGNVYSTDASNYGYFIGGKGSNCIAAHATAAATGSVTITSTGDPSGNAGQYLSVAIISGAGVDVVGFGVNFSNVSSVSATATNGGEAAVLLAQGGMSSGTNTWTPGTKQYWSANTGPNILDETTVVTTTASAGLNTLTETGTGNAVHAVALFLLTSGYTTPTVGTITTGIELGAPTLIYFGLLDATGAFIGTPYLIWRGVTDQPTVDVDTSTFTLTLELENPLTNLSRATGRRYTAADQRHYYPDDTAFNWVEMLNDIALRWGS